MQASETRYLSDEQFNVLLNKQSQLQKKTNKTNLILAIVLPIVFLIISLGVFLIVFFLAR